MKKLFLITILIALMMCAAVLSASCGKEDTAGRGGRISVVATIFPEYDWTREIVGADNSNVDVSLLVRNGADLHSYQPTVDDIMKISSCDVFIYVGGESDEWVAEVLERAENSRMKVVRLMDILGSGAKEEETVEGMEDGDHEDGDHEGDEHEDGGHEDGGHEDGDHEAEYDEHVWLSMRNAAMFCEAIKDTLCDVDEENSETYERNAESYINEVLGLDLEYDRVVSEAEKNVLIFGDRFPFRYLTDDHGIRYFAAFTGCSAETEASFETVRFLADKVDEYGVGCIMTIDGSDGSIARTVSENTRSKDQEILTLDSMQSVTQKEIDEGASYLGIMESNLEVLEKALRVDR